MENNPLTFMAGSRRYHGTHRSMIAMLENEKPVKVESNLLLLYSWICQKLLISESWLVACKFCMHMASEIKH